MDAKNLHAESISLRCEIAPATKKVQLWYPGWLIFADGCVESNVWASSQLMLERRDFQTSHVIYPRSVPTITLLASF